MESTRTLFQSSKTAYNSVVTHLVSNTHWTPNKELSNLASTSRGRGHPVPELRDHIAMKDGQN